MKKSKRVAPETSESLDVLNVSMDSRQTVKTDRSKATMRSSATEENDDVGKEQSDKDIYQLEKSWREKSPQQHDVGFWRWLLTPAPAPPKRWERSRRIEISEWIRQMRKSGVIRALLSESTLYKIKATSRLKYHGERDDEGRKDGRGVAKWPDPPYGGGEEYMGLWRGDQPNTSGVLCWFNGDIYMGEFMEGGKFQGSGVYRYGDTGEFAGDVFRGTYIAGLRTGQGVYQFNANGSRPQGGEYIGQWLKGKFHGLGVLRYKDGESFVGDWTHDLKNGLGRYTWGKDSGDIAGDYYQGEVVSGKIEGFGCYRTADGGFHKGCYVDGMREGWGIQRASDGTQHMGQWSRDKLHGHFVTYNAYQQLRANSKEVQLYTHGQYISSRPYHASDYSQIELPALEAEMQADKKFQEAARVVQNARSKQVYAKEAAERAAKAEAKAIYWAEEALKLKEKIRAWFGLKGMIFPDE